MRSSFLAVLCVGMVVGIMADDLILGERKEGDYVVANRTIFKPPLPWKSMIATVGVKTSTEDEVLTQVSYTNIGDKEATFSLIKGDVGTGNVVVMAVGKRGEGLSIRVEGFAINIATTTTEATTTSVPTSSPSTETTTIGTTTEGGDNGSTTEGGDNGSTTEGGDNGSTTEGGDDGNNTTPDDGDNGSTTEGGDDGNNTTPDDGDNGSTTEGGDNGNTTDGGNDGDDNDNSGNVGTDQV